MSRDIQHEGGLFSADSAGRLDWSAIWQQMVVAEHAQTAATATDQASWHGDYWAGHAQRFAQAVERKPQPDAFMDFVLPQLHSSDCILDIGAGVGRYSVFLAGQVDQVVAVEPSMAMRDQMEQRMAYHRIKNVTMFPEGWPAADVSPCDIAICAHVIYSIREISPFLLKMNDVARRACFILAGMRQPSFVLRAFWERIYGIRRLPLPGALECLNVLYQLGIQAQLALLPSATFTFTDQHEAFENLRWRLGLPDEPNSNDTLRQAIADLLVGSDDGGLAPPDPAPATAVIWWAK